MPEKKPLILIIEDEQVVVRILTQELFDQGYKVISAVDGESGLEQASHSNPALILLDIILPKINGFEVLKKLKENPQTKNIPVLILSNLGQDDEIKKGKELGAVEYLVKANIDLKKVMEKISNIIKK